jgi:3-phenylpropionate/trans-cinnamate dioxygenase ferredoxin subunit
VSQSSATSRWISVARASEIAVGASRLIRLEDVPIAVFHLDDGWYAIEDVCTHDGGPVAEGRLEGHVIECPRHGATFDVKTGTALTFPGVSPVPTYAVRVVGDDVQVEWS